MASQRSWKIPFVALAAIWGASFLFIKVGVEALAPLQVAFARCAIGAAVLGVWLAATRERVPRDAGLLGHMAMAGLLFCAVPFSLFSWAETHVTSVVAGIWNAATPLLTLLAVLVLVPAERPTRERVAGLALGFLGVVVVLGPWDAGAGGPALAQLACLGAAACYGLGFAYLRRFVSGRPESGVLLSALQLGWATLMLAPLALAGGVPDALPADVVASMLALGALGSGLAYVLNFRVLRAAGPATASSVTYLVPIFSTAFGILLLGEGLTWHQPVGAAIVLLGVAVSQGRLAALGRAPRTAET
jgi:drug/metabolite transporter (DMT)-like permease